jgi:hypothetical protein
MGRQIRRRTWLIVVASVSTLAYGLLLLRTNSSLLFDSVKWKQGHLSSRARMATNPSFRSLLLGASQERVLDLLGEPKYKFPGRLDPQRSDWHYTIGHSFFLGDRNLGVSFNRGICDTVILGDD